MTQFETLFKPQIFVEWFSGKISGKSPTFDGVKNLLKRQFFTIFLILHINGYRMVITVQISGNGNGNGNGITGNHRYHYRKENPYSSLRALNLHVADDFPD
jgi:hypothetical protein